MPILWLGCCALRVDFPIWGQSGQDQVLFDALLNLNEGTEFDGGLIGLIDAGEWAHQYPVNARFGKNLTGFAEDLVIGRHLRHQGFRVVFVAEGTNLQIQRNSMDGHQCGGIAHGNLLNPHTILGHHCAIFFGMVLRDCVGSHFFNEYFSATLLDVVQLIRGGITEIDDSAT